MKSLIVAFFSLVLSCSVLAQQNPTVLEINGKKVSQTEFLQIYLKNNPNPKYDKASLDEYMDLFKKFKLKVAEAERLGYDTMPKLRRELDGYRKSLSMPYMVDNDKNDELLKEAYNRLKEEIRASHILIRLGDNPSSTDTLIAYNKLMKIKKRIERGEDFTVVARSPGGSEDPFVADNGGDLGYFTAFQMVYPFEEAAYNTAVGELSDIVRTRFGYHLLKVVDKRPARGTMTVAHIMIASADSDSEQDRENQRKKADEIYQQILAGEVFETMVASYSDDYNTSEKGGVLPPFGTGTTTRMLPAFENAAFELKTDGAISKPIETPYGFHIIKRLMWKDLASYDEMERDLKNKIKRDERSKKTQDLFVSKLMKEYGFTDKSKKTLKVFTDGMDSTYFEGKWSASQVKSNKEMFNLDGQKFTQQAFANYLAGNYKAVPKGDVNDAIQTQYKSWIKQSVLDYEDSRLEQKHPEFKALMQEYHDGILLYEIMTDKVWNKANQDTAGLADFYTLNMFKYMWKERMDGVIYECKNADIANKVYKMLQVDTVDAFQVLSVINADSELNLRTRSGKYEIEETKFLKGKKIEKGVNKPYAFDDKYYVLKVDELIPTSTKAFDEAKGAITSDYQEQLEKEWLAELAKRHQIKVYDEVLYSIGKK